MNIHETKVINFFIVTILSIFFLMLFLLMIDGCSKPITEFRDAVLAIGGGIAGGLSYSYFQKANNN